MKIKEVIIVEGTSDKQFLETFLDADFLICNGSAMDGFDFTYLKEIAATRGVIILTDPDYPGEKIRKEIAAILPTCTHAFVRKEFSIAHHKVGVAESTKEEVLRALKNKITLTDVKMGDLQASDLFELQLLGEHSAKNKKRIMEVFHLGHCNGKTLLKRLNMLHICKQQLKEALND